MSGPLKDTAVVVGAGHNALVAACYLARAGLDVEVVERDTVVGGAVSTVERFPGYRMDRGSSAHIMVRHTGIVEDLRLTECGLEYQDLDPWGFAPFPSDDGGAQGIHFHVDLDRTCASIESVCGTRDADAYRAFVLDWSARNLKVFEASFKMRFNVITCLGGTSALELLRNRPDIGVLITDQRMPVMSGVELLEKVREEFPDVQRMIITAYSDMQAVVASVNRGQVSRYFVKPWVREELSAALEDALKIYELQTRVREVQMRMLGSERLAAIGQVSAGIAHELMNPVSYLTQNVSTLRTEMAEISQYVRGQLVSAPSDMVSGLLNEMPALLDDIVKGASLVRELALGIRSQARGEDKADHSDLAEVVEFASRIARAEVRQRAEMTVTGVPIRVRGGQVKLTQVLLNLIVNAAQAMDGIGRKGKIEVGWEDAGDKGIHLWVRDNGAGIPTENFEKVFEPMFTTRPVGVGTGLGLAICKDLIQTIGGAITLDSTVGKGTTIELWLQRPLLAVSSQVG